MHSITLHYIMKKKIQHFILTRMALGSPSVDWLLHRFDIFERFCVPSIRSQTSQDFAWLLAISRAAPDWIVQRLRHCAPNAIVVFGERRFCNWARIIAPMVRPDFSLLTTRFDNDDILHRTFVEVMQNEARCLPDCTVLDCPLGYQMDFHTLRCGLHRTRFPSPFSSLIERASDKKRTVFCAPHMDLAKSHPYYCIDTRPLWVQLCHERNRKNKVKVTLGHDWRELLPDFGGGN
jgi:Putative rhamnosyl transferase